MKCLSARLLATSIFLLAAAASSARADYMMWGYGTTATPPVVSSGTGSIQLTGISAGTSGASIPILALQDSSLATSGAPDVYHASYSMAMLITDSVTHDSKTLTLSGLLQGNLTSTTSSVTNTLTGPNSVTLDGHIYTLTIPSLLLTAPGTAQQTLDARISVTNVTGNGNGGGPAATPEPASLVLGGLGFSLLGIGGWWKRRRRPEPSV